MGRARLSTEGSFPWRAEPGGVPRSLLIHGIAPLLEVIRHVARRLPEHRVVLYESHVSETPDLAGRVEDLQQPEPGGWTRFLMDRWSRRLTRRVRRTEGLPPYLPDLILAHSARHLEAIVRLTEGLDRLHRASPIDLIVLNDDVRLNTKSICHWARRRRVPTLQVSHANLCYYHGVIETDYVAVPGTQTRDFHVQSGVPESRIRITGKPSWDRYAVPFPRRGAGVPVVLYATTWTNAMAAPLISQPVIEHFRRFVDGFRQARSATPMELVVKLPPHQAALAGHYRAVAEAGGIVPADVTAEGLEDCLRASDVVVCLDSNLGCEAILVDRPVINFRPFPLPWSLFDEQDAVLQADTSERLARALTEALLSEDARHVLAERRSRSIERFNYRNDGGAGARVTELILELSGGRPPLGTRLADRRVRP